MADDTWDLAQTDAPPAVVPPPSAGAAPSGIDYAAIAKQLLQQPTLPQPDTTPVTRGLLSRLGEALGGGQVSGVMSPAQQEMAGLRALQHFGTSLIAGSGYHPGQPALGAFATGFEGAAQSERGSEQGAAATLAAQQQYAAGQQQQYLARLKEALPLLRMDAGANIPNALLSANTPAVPGTAGGAGKPGGGGIALGMRQNNPLNLTFAGQPGAQPGQGNQFATFSDIPSGVAATADQLALYQTQHGISTVKDAVERWVGPKDVAAKPKEIAAYIADTAAALGVAPTDKIDLTNPTVQQKFILAAQPHESGGGGAVLNPADVAKGVQLAAANRGQTVQAPPAPYQVTTAGNGVPGPPSSSTTASAATPPAPSQTPPAASAAPAPPAPPTFTDFQAKNPIPTTPEEQATLDGLRRVQQQTATELQNAPLTGVDRVKAVQAAREAADNLATATRGIQDAHTAHQVTLYNADQQRQAQAGIETQRIEAAAAEAERQRQAALNIEQVKAGITQRQKQADADVAAGSKLSETYDANAAHAGEIHTMLAQLGPNLQNLPQGFAAQLMAQHPGLVTTMANAGLIDPKTRDAVQLVTGLNNYLSVALRPLQSGSLRSVEMEKFQGALPNMLQSPAGQQKALAFLLNMTDRVQKEADYVRGQFHRPIPDPTNPNATLPAYNLPPDLFSKMDKDLGPVLPHYSGGAPTDATAADYQKYVQSQKPGMPYYGYTRVVRNGQPVLDKNGRQVMREELQVAPEE